jgi:hypothetical protein
VCETHEAFKIKHLQLATSNHLLQHKTKRTKTFGNILLQHMQHPDKKRLQQHLKIDEAF